MSTNRPGFNEVRIAEMLPKAQFQLE